MNDYLNTQPDTLPPEAAESVPPSLPASPEPEAEPARLARWSLRSWFKAGQRAAFFRSVAVAGQQITALQFTAVLLILLGIPLALGRLEIDGDALFNAGAWLLQWAYLPLLALIAWWVLQYGRFNEIASDGHASAAPVATHLSVFLGVLFTAYIPLYVLAAGLAVVSVRLPDWFAHPYASKALLIAAWGVFIWFIAVNFWVARLFKLSLGWTLTFVISSAGLSYALNTQFSERAWDIDYSAQSRDEPPRMQLSQALFEEQTTLLQTQLTALATERPGVRDVYAVVFAPYASENVFLNENKMVSDVLTTRFDAAGRIVPLVNHTSTTATLAWATPLNLERSLQAIAQKMDKDNDVLLIYMTSHGASDFKLAANHWPLTVDQLTPTSLAAMLDKAGIRHRVLIISACYAGGWIPALANDTSLVMTAADATHTSYGCGYKSELTYFGRALFDEQLRKTYSFEEAFKKAVPIIEQREKEGGKTDGFSNPQIKMGAQIKPVLEELAQRLAQSPAVAEPSASAVSAALPAAAPASAASSSN
jgi:Peptidase C13 family